jgi:hypothetical protein
MVRYCFIGGWKYCVKNLLWQNSLTLVNCKYTANLHKITFRLYCSPPPPPTPDVDSLNPFANHQVASTDNVTKQAPIITPISCLWAATNRPEFKAELDKRLPKEGFRFECKYDLRLCLVCYISKPDY